MNQSGLRRRRVTRVRSVAAKTTKMSRSRQYCGVYGCLQNSYRSSELSFFKIPREIEIRTQWLRLMSREELIEKEVVSHRVCEIHFREQDILKPEKGRKRLRKNTLPSLNLPSQPTGDKCTQTELTINTSSTQTHQFASIKSENVTINNSSSVTDQDTHQFPIIKSENLTIDYSYSDIDQVESENFTIDYSDGESTQVKSENLTIDYSESDQIKSENLTIDYTDSESVQVKSENFTIIDDFYSESDQVESENCSHTGASHSAGNSRKHKLKSEIKNCQKRLKTEEAEQTGKTFQKDVFHKLCDRFLSNNLAELVKAQTYLKSNCKGNRYPLEYKLFCLNLYYVNPQAYRLLQKTICLPSEVTLSKLYIPMCTQVTDSLMEALKTKVNDMSDAEKQCTLVVDAMSLKTNLYYDNKHDKIIGFHEVDGIQSPLPAKYALTVLIRGIFVKWSQPVGFALVAECKNDDNISKWIDKLLLKLFEMGLKVRAFVSDLGSDILNAAEEKGISTDKTHFHINGHKIYYIFDAPHLITSVRNNFLTYDFHFGNEAVAKFEHILEFYEQDKIKTFKQAYKLTNSHINPSNSEKMKVRYATELLSRSVAAGLSSCIDAKVIDESAKDTVELIKIMNDLFDALNSSVTRHRYAYKRAFHGDESQILFFNNMLSFFQTLKLINSKTGMDVTKSVKFVEGFQITIKSILSLHENLKQEGYQYLRTRRLNQDITKSFFEKIRSLNGKATKLTSRQFVSAFRRNLFANLHQPPTKDKSAEVEDFNKFLVHIKDFETRLNECSDIVNPSSTNVQENILREIVRSDYIDMHIPEQNALFYICGALLRKCLNHHKDCELFKSYRDPNGFVKIVDKMEHVFRSAFQKQYLNCKIGLSIYEGMNEIELKLPCPCFPKQYLFKLYIRMRIYFTLKNNNQEFRISRNRRKKFCVANL